MIKYEQKLPSQYQEVVFTMLAAADEEFVPLLKELGFGEIATLKDDRGIGIDTIYFLKTVCD